MPPKIFSVCLLCSHAEMSLDPLSELTFSFNKVIEVHVERGMRNGDRVTMYGEGEQEPGLQPGDVIIVSSLGDFLVFVVFVLFLFLFFVFFAFFLWCASVVVILFYF